MKNKLLTLAFGLFVSAAIFTVSSPSVSATDYTWDGGGSDNNLATMANWVGDPVGPLADSDTLIFDVSTAPSDSFAIVNSATLANFVGITFTGTLSPYDATKKFTFTGTGTTTFDTSVKNNMVNAPDPEINTNVSITGTTTITSDINDSEVRSIVFNKTPTQSIAVGGNVTISNVSLDVPTGSISAPGGISITITDGSINGDGLANGSLNFAGNVHVGVGGNFDIDANASYSWAGLYLDGGRVTFLQTTTDKTFDRNISVNSASGGDGMGLGGDALGMYSTTDSPVTLTLSGTLSLLDDLYISSLQTGANAYQTLKFTGPISGLYHIYHTTASEGNLAVNSSSNISQTPNGTYAQPTATTTLTDSLPTTPVGAYRNQTFVINGTRGSIYISFGGVLKGTGTVGVVVADGKIAPGLSPGILNTGNLSFTSSGSLDEEIGGTASGEYDQINVTGTVDLGSATLNTTHWNGFVPAVGNAFTIINNDGADAITGTFAGLANNATFTVAGVTYQINYAGGTGNDVVLTVTAVTAPTPGTPNTGAKQASYIGIAIASFVALAVANKLMNKKSFVFATFKKKK